GNVDYYNADVITANDYYPGGMQMPVRKYGTMGRHGFNGKEQDAEVSGEGNQYDYGFRIYDPRIVRFKSIDPLAEQFPSWSPYNYAMNNPLRFVDPTGMAPEDFIVLSQSGEELRRIKMEGEDIYVKVNESAFNQASSRFDNNVEDY